QLTVTRRRGTQTLTLGSNLLGHLGQSPSFLYFIQLQNNDFIMIGTGATNTLIIIPTAVLTYNESYSQPQTNGLFVFVPLAGNYFLPQSWTDSNSFAGLVPGQHWCCGVSYV